MKRSAVPWVPLVLAALAGAGCPPPPPEEGDDAGPARQCEVDLNLAPEDAVAIEHATQVDGYLCPQRDLDFYAFTVAEDRSIVTVRLWMDTGVVTAVEPGYTLLDASGAAIGAALFDATRSQGEAPDFTASHRIDAAGTYLLRVADFEGLDDGKDVVNPYHLEVSVAPNPDLAEPNDTDDSAAPIQPGTTTGVIATTGDEDWFAVAIEQPGQVLDVTATAPLESGVDHVLEVLGPDGLLLLDTQPLVIDEDAPERVIARIRAPASGAAGTTYFVRVHDDDDLDAQLDPDVGTYTLVVAVAADQDPQEGAVRNDTPDTATPATSAATFTAALATRGDQDMWRIAAPVGTSRANPAVLLVEVAFAGAAPPDLRPQVRMLSLDPEDTDDELEACGACDEVCLPVSGGRCGEARLQRFIDDATFRTAVPLRDARPVFVAVNDVGDDAFQETATYTITFTITDDPDPGEAGDDYLIPNLESAGYANEDDLRRQEERSKPRARAQGAGGIPPACPSDPDTGAPAAPEPPADAGPVAPSDAGPVDAPDGGAVDPGDGGVADDAGASDAGPPPPPPTECLAIVPVPAPGPGGQRGYTTQCSGESATFQLTGRISYEGDRDWFRVDVPAEGYWGLDFTYDVSEVTPVELTFFVHTVGDLIANDLVAEEVEDAPSPCGTTLDRQCPADSVCVDERCWYEVDDNAALADEVFPIAADDECAYVHVNDARDDAFQRPIFIEVTDNGINDFDLEMQYTITLRVRCGCPATCNGDFDACQGVAPPAGG